MSVFAGGCTREAAEAVCAGAPIETRRCSRCLGELVARSLVVAERGGLDTRYRLLETIREYGEERLAEHDETEALRQRHAGHYAEYALRCYATCVGTGTDRVGCPHGCRRREHRRCVRSRSRRPRVDLAVSLFESTSMIPIQTGYVLIASAAPSWPSPGSSSTPASRSCSWPPRSRPTRGRGEPRPRVRRRCARCRTCRDRATHLHHSTSARCGASSRGSSALDRRVGRCRSGVPRRCGAPSACGTAQLRGVESRRSRVGTVLRRAIRRRRPRRDRSRRSGARSACRRSSR